MELRDFEFLLLKTYTKLYKLWKQHQKQREEQLISLIDPTCPEACLLIRNVGKDLIESDKSLAFFLHTTALYHVVFK